MDELTPEGLMKALEWWIFNFHGNATEFQTLCAAHRILRGKDMEIEGLRNNLDVAIEMANRIRAETITEFAEKVKQAYPLISSVVVEGIDKIAEEMKGETDER